MLIPFLTPLWPILRKAWPQLLGGVAVLLVTLYARHEHARADKEADQVAIWRDAEHNWRQAYTIQRRSFDVLHGALQEQNAAVQRLKADGDARVQAGKDALVQTEPELQALRAAAAKMRAVQQTSATGCHTNDAVMALKEQI